MNNQSIKHVVMRSVIFGSLVLFSIQAWACEIKNGNFESGDFSEWTNFTTPNGTVGGDGFPLHVDFDIKADGQVSKSASFKVGQLSYQSKGASLAGGGIFTNLYLNEGTVVITLDVASAYSSPKDRRNLAGGLFEVLLDGEVIASHDIGPIPNNTTQRSTIEGVTNIESGMHELRIRILRPFKSLPHDHAPRQYLDNIRLEYKPT